jgi:hypothetical protein
VRKAVSESRIFISADLLKEYRDVPSALASQGKITVEQFNTLIAGIAAVVATASLVSPRKRVKVCRDSSVNCGHGFAAKNARACASSGRAVPWPATSTNREK